MTLEHISELSQAIAAIAVLISLIYLAWQTRISAQSQRAMMHGDRSEWVSNVLLRIADPDFAEVWRAGVAASPDLSPLDAHRFAYVTMAHLMGFQHVYLDWRAGLIDATRWEQTHRAMGGYLRLPRYRATYSSLHANLDPGFRRLGDRFVAEAKADPGWDTARIWLELAGRERTAIAAGAT